MFVFFFRNVLVDSLGDPSLEGWKQLFEKMCVKCHQGAAILPIDFILGFFVNWVGFFLLLFLNKTFFLFLLLLLLLILFCLLLWLCSSSCFFSIAKSPVAPAPVAPAPTNPPGGEQVVGPVPGSSLG